MPIDYTKFASDDADAAERAKLFLEADPLRSIPRSLLSSAEIHDYARLTGMLFPFYEDALKSASYEAHIGGKVIWWDEERVRHEVELNRGAPLVLARNSITFVEVEPTFRLPNYIAIRFNLRISHVHRGLLLGTGPLVDPGFSGKLLIPLHNLTASEYEIDTQDALIWIEFTKTSFGFEPEESEASNVRHFKAFPERKKHMRPDEYLFRASGGEPIQSSIPAAIADANKLSHAASTSASMATKSAKAAETTVTEIRNRLTRIGILGLVALVIALATLYFQMHGLIQSSISLSGSFGPSLAAVAGETKSNSEKLSLLEKQLEGMTSQLNGVIINIRSAGTIWTPEEFQRIDSQLRLLRSDVDDLRRRAVEIQPPDIPQ